MAKKNPQPADEVAAQVEADLAALDRVSVTSARIAAWFSTFRPDAEQQMRIERIRRYGAAFSQVIADSTPAGDDQAEALHQVRLAVINAFAAVLGKGR